MADLLLDTSILVDQLRHDPRTLDWLRSLPPEQAGCISAISVAEVIAGARSLSEQRNLKRRLREFRTLHVSEDISILALRWFSSLHLSKGVGFLDCLIGATAKTYEMPVCTMNRKHFEPMRGLKVIVPY